MRKEEAAPSKRGGVAAGLESADVFGVDFDVGHRAVHAPFDGSDVVLFFEAARLGRGDGGAEAHEGDGEGKDEDFRIHVKAAHGRAALGLSRPQSASCGWSTLRPLCIVARGAGVKADVFAAFLWRGPSASRCPGCRGGLALCLAGPGTPSGPIGPQPLLIPAPPLGDPVALPYPLRQTQRLASPLANRFTFVLVNRNVLVQARACTVR